MYICRTFCNLVRWPHYGAVTDAFAHTVFSLNVSEQLRYSPLQDYHLDWRDPFSSQSSIYSFQHLFLLVRGDEDPSFPVGMRLCELSGLVFRYKLVSLAKRTSAAKSLTYVEPVPLFLAVVRSCSGLLDRRIYPNTHDGRLVQQERIEECQPGSGTTESKRSWRF